MQFDTRLHSFVGHEPQAVWYSASTGKDNAAAEVFEKGLHVTNQTFRFVEAGMERVTFASDEYAERVASVEDW